MTSEMERILGAKIGRPEALPGQTGDQCRAIYVSYPSNRKPIPLLKEVVNYQEPVLASSGGVVFDESIVTIPDGTQFYSLALNGDLSGWHKQIEAGANHFGLLTGVWSGENFAVNDGRNFNSSDCILKNGWSE